MATHAQLAPLGYARALRYAASLRFAVTQGAGEYPATPRRRVRLALVLNVYRRAHFRPVV